MINHEDDTPDAIEWFRYARQVQKDQLRQLARQGQLVSQISHVVHMLQCERGASNIWLCSQGRLYGAERRASAALVDEQLRPLLRCLSPRHLPSTSGLCQRIARAVWSLEQLPALRENVASRQIAAETATGQFSRTIRHLLNIIPQLNDSIDDPQLAARLVALYSFMQGKELVGQERALGAQGFALGCFSQELRQRLVDRIDGQQPCFDSFLSLATSPLKMLFYTECQAGIAIEQLRRIACTRQPGEDDGETALRWFQLQTQRLEQMRGLEELLIGELMTAVDGLLLDDNAPDPRQDDAVSDGMLLHLDRQLLPLVRQQARELEQLSSQLASLKDTLEERRLIDKAKGVLMTYRQMNEEQAWHCLRKMAMEKNQRMVEIARALLAVKTLWQQEAPPPLHNERA
ncbi:TPA: ANTAR domain-containing protein [Kluyvera ascorbata]|uniref:Transcriptional regulator n=1 Tax=Kluyvera genomosp. 2 TaxID=2774054 RepID=A0A2T2XYU9_9ENTR|nr:MULTISPECIES: nitrate regulatory protein NasR [Enterobacteriaceae]HAT3919646.1 ANTAR domain-containing protein [Kluyvera ascorbata]PSR45479.1 transcriptional regulator [Kluyvera genomosp. 2]BBQ84123.1 nitrate regulatory protein [Klebsiella sp. WP3-W18-ESBL-02]BBR21129.1 nitrate regulatory protein [Klebsiella sp. WP3-S18-ESBL-05]BBT71317.1 nitrate regulatory protein [Klebsiella sp. WP8-S18-ESBL-06]